MAKHKVNQGQPYRYTAVVLSCPAAITKAWLTVKANLEDADEDALFQKVVTTTDSVDGLVVADGAIDGRGRVRFELRHEDTETIVPGETPVYDIQVLCDGDPLTSERGTFRSERRVTQAVA